VKTDYHPEVLVVGSINADTSYLVAELPKPGETVLSTGRLDAPGGKGANQAAALAALGVSVEFVAAIGDDDSGRALVDGLSRRGVGVTGIATITSHPTGSAVILVSASGENSIVVHQGANGAMSPEHVKDATALLSPAIVLTQLEIPLAAVAQASKVSGALLIVNPAPMPVRDSELDQILRAADILVPNRTELASLAGIATPVSLDEVIKCARGLDFAGQLIVTLGAEGAVVFPAGVTGDHEIVPAPQVKATDTSGAGDAFCAALAAALSQGKTLVQATTSACEFASWTTTQPGAQVPDSRLKGLSLSV
jgi:ribokinase